MRQGGPFRKGAELSERLRRVGDYSGRACERIGHSPAMFQCFRRPAELGMADGNQIMDEMDGADPMASNPERKGLIVEPSMAHVEINLSMSRL